MVHITIQIALLACRKCDTSFPDAVQELLFSETENGEGGIKYQLNSIGSVPWGEGCAEKGPLFHFFDIHFGKQMSSTFSGISD